MEWFCNRLRGPANSFRRSNIPFWFPRSDIPGLTCYAGSVHTFPKETTMKTIRTMRVGAGAAMLALSLIACAPSTPPQETAQPAPEPAPGGTVTLQPTQGNEATGTLVLMSMGDGVHFTGTVTGLPPGPHGFHIHETGDCSAPDAASAGGHFNPTNLAHGSPTAAPHHLGDLGNIQADADGNAEVNVHASGITLTEGASSIKAKAVIVHAAADDFTTQPTGNAGARLACGVIQ
jgi:Cu-Zn family superoxide dismutase